MVQLGHLVLRYLELASSFGCKDGLFDGKDATRLE